LSFKITKKHEFYEKRTPMKTTLELDEQLLNEAQTLTQAESKQEVVNLALKTLVQSLRRRRMLNLRGKVQGEGNLDEMRAA